VPVGPGAESVRIELYAPDPSASRWDSAVWDGGHWAAYVWSVVGCQVMEAAYLYGATDEAGVLSLPVAGGLDLTTRDLARELDPSNAEGPFFGYVTPGTPVRLATSPAAGSVPAFTGYLDSTTYDVASARGQLRAVDGIAYLAQADLADGLALPNTLRARIRAITAAAGLSAVVQLAPDVPDMETDPPVAAYDGKKKTAWTAILDAAQDALYYVWLGPAGYLHATSWGAFPDAPFALGCGDPLEGPWIEGVRTIGYGSSAEAIRNGIRAWSAPSVNTAVLSDQPSVNRYGLRTFAVDRVVPDFATWSSRILTDRAGAGLAVKLGEVRPYDVAELQLLLGLATAGPQIVRVRDEDHPPVIDQTVGAIGASVRVTSAGWSFAVVSMIPRAEWDAVEPPVPPPIDPPPGQTWHTETRSYLATSDTLLALTPGGAKYGAGAADTLPVGAWSGWTYRSCMKLATIPFTKVKRIVSATLRLDTTTQIRVGFGSSPTIECRRITTPWNAGTGTTPGSNPGGAVYPGPSTTSTGAKRANVSGSQNAAVAIDVTALARAWAPSAAGGSAAAQYGVMLLPGSGSQADTTEFWPVEKGGSLRPQLDLVVEVFD
jgi:hypothetical protein